MRKATRVLAFVLFTLTPLLVVGHFLLQMESFRVFAASWVLGRHVNERPCAIEPGRKFTIDYHGMTYYGDSSTLIDHAVLCWGDFGLSELTFFEAAAKRSDIEDPVFLDVGANSGLHSLYMSRFAGTVHSFEPYPPVLERFGRSIAASGIGNIVVHPVGLGESSESLPFEEPPDDNLGTGSFVAGLKESNSANGLELQIVQGDAYFREHGIDRVDIFKIDTEGFEKAVLGGLRETLVANRPVGALELTQEPGFDHLFRSRDELLSYLPPDYALYVATWTREGGPRLERFDLSFEEGRSHQAVVAVIPIELEERFADLIE